MKYKMNIYTYFSKSVMQFEEDGVLYEPPKFVERARARYRFDHERKILQRLCLDCEVFIDTQVFEDGEFRDIHDEDVIHFMGDISGYGVRCKDCDYKYKMEKENASLADSLEPVDVIGKIGQNEELIVILSAQNQELLKVVSEIKGISIDELINELLDKVRSHNNFTFTYEENL